MIIFETIRWKNFLSTGNYFSEVKLNDSANALIIGKNGSGKSTILDALTFALFGKPFRNVNKPILINSINEKNCVVEIEFKVNSVSYKIIRGMKPNVFEIYQNSKLLDQDSKIRDYQEYLESSILKMNYKAFTQIVLLGAASFVPFMQLSAADRRAIIEELLDIQIFSVMNVIAKQKMQSNKEDMERNKLVYDLLMQKMIVLSNTIRRLSEFNSEKSAEIEEQIVELKNEIKDLEKTIKISLDETLEEVEADIKKSNSKRMELSKLQFQMETALDKLNQENVLFHDQENCHKCHQKLENDFKAEIVKSNDLKKIEYTSGLEKMKVLISKLDDELHTFMKRKKDLIVEINNNHHNKEKIDSKKKQIEVLKKSLDEPDNLHILEENKFLFEKEKKEAKSLEAEKASLLEKKKNIELILSLLKDGGIKTKIIKQYLPIINKTINKYLQQMDFYINFNINESFEESIKSRYRDDFAYESFSEGEKMRIDLALLFTWRAVAKMKNSINTNLLVLDEIFDSSLDGEGTDEFLKIMSNLTKDTNTFIISHKRDQLLDKFEKVIRFEKRNDFSRIVE